MELIKNKSILKNFFKIIISNCFNLIIGIIISFILPKYMGPDEYGKYSYYLILLSYITLFSFGFTEGIFLVYSGEEYEKCNKQKLNIYFKIYLYELIICSISFFIFVQVKFFSNRYMLFILTLNILVSNLNSFFILISQVFSKFDVYSKLNIVEKIVFLLGILLLKYNDILIFNNIIIILLFGKIIVLYQYIYNYKELILIKSIKINKEIIEKIIEIYRRGITIVLSALMLIYITSYGKLLVEKYLGMKELGYFSFANSFGVILNQIYIAISIIVYPLFCRDKIQNRNVYMINKFLNISLPLTLFLILPFFEIIEKFFREFLEAKKYLYYLILVFIFQGKKIIIYDNYFKAAGIEKKIFYNTIIIFSFCLLIYYIFDTINFGFKIIMNVIICIILCLDLINLLKMGKIFRRDLTTYIFYGILLNYLIYINIFIF